MAYSRKPNYHFNGKTNTGIDKVPMGRLVLVEDYDNTSKGFIKVYDSTLSDTTTIEEALALGALEPYGQDELFVSKITKYVATVGQTTFNANYNVGFVEVYQNGTQLSNEQFISTNTTSITLKAGAQEDDDIKIVSLYTTASYSLMYQDFFDDGVLSGLESTVSVNLTGTITSGIIYLSGKRTDIKSITHSFTASTETYVDVTSLGEFTFQEVSIGTAAPVLAEGNMRIMMITTDVDNIVGYNDLRTFIPSHITALFDDESPTLSAALDYNNHEALGFCVNQDINVTVPNGTTHDFDFSVGNSQEITCAPGSTMTLAFTNFPTNKVSTYTIFIIDGGGATITYPAGTLFEGGVVPTLTSNGTDILSVTIDKDGTPIITVVGLDLKTV